MRLISLAVLFLAATASAQVTKTTTSVTVPNCGNGPATHDVDVYRPAGAGPFPLVALGHGFQNSKDNFAGLAQALGALGIVVVAPQFPGFLSGCGSDHARNGRVLLAAIDQQLAAGGIDATKLALGGHSAGGLAAFLAASQRSVAAVMLFDPVDNSMLGANAAAMVSEPTLFLFAEPSGCNTQSNATGWFASVTGPKARLKVVNAKHCDPQEPISSVCTLGCGANDMGTTARQAVFKRYALAFFSRYLKGVTAPCLETTAQTDATAGTIASVDFHLGGCGGALDAGVAPADAGQPVIDAGTSGMDAGSPTADAGSTPLDAGTPSQDAGAPFEDAGTGAGGGAGGGGGSSMGSGGGMAGNGGGEASGGGTGAAVDAGVDPGTDVPSSGCGCAAVDPWAVFAALSLVALTRRRKG